MICLYTIMDDLKANGQGVQDGGIVVDCLYHVLTLITIPHCNSYMTIWEGGLSVSSLLRSLMRLSHLVLE